MDRVRPLVCPILVGRDDLLALADRRLDQVRGGTGHLLLLAGEAGIGKSRLLASIERTAVRQGLRSVRGGTYPSDLQVAAAVILDLAASMTRTDDLGGIGRRLSERLADIDAGSGDAHRRRRLLVGDVAEILAGSAADRPVMIALEDLHWSDDLTLEILAALARRLPDVPLMVVATYRSDELFPRVPMRDWRARLLSQRLAEEARLERLSPDGTAMMTSLLAVGGEPAPRDVADVVHARTDGIPLHVEELLGMLAASGLPAAGAIRESAVPDTVEATILGRLDHRSGPARDVATAGAVIGRSFDVDLLASVVDLPLERLTEPLAELADHFVLLPTSDPGRLGFRHALICDSIYARTPASERRRLHARVALASEGRTDASGSPAFLSLHYERAGRADDAFRTALAGARAATSMSSRREARELYERAARHLPAGLDDAERGGILEELAVSAAATDDNQAAGDAFEGARVAYRRAGLTNEAAAVVAPLVSVRHLLGDGLDARAARLREALGELDGPVAIHSPSADPASDRVRAKLLAGLSAAYMLDRRLEPAITYGAEARRLAAAVGDERTDRNAAASVGSCLVFAGRMTDGWALLEEVVARSRHAQLEAEAARGYRMLGSSASVLVEYPRAERWLRDGIDYAERVELWNDRHYMAAHLGHVLWATGRWDEAESVAAHARADGRGGITTRITALHVLGFVALGRGRLHEATAVLDEARTLGEQMDELQRLSPALWGLAEAAWLAGRPGDAVALAERAAAASAVVVDAAYLFPFLVTGTRAYLALGDPLAAGRWIDRLEGPIRDRSIPGTLPAIDHARGLLLLAEGATGRARAALAAAADGWRRLDRTWEATWAVVDQARCAARSRQRPEAVRLAAGARDVAGRLGSPSLLAAAADILGAGRRAAADEPWAPLTAREFEVARLVANGQTNPSIAAELDIAPRTVAAHVEHILAKLGAGRRSEIAAWTAARPVLHSAPHGGDREE